MPRILTNPDGTVNPDALQKELNFIKGKYASNLENLKRNLALEKQQDSQAQVADSSKAGEAAVTDAQTNRAAAPNEDKV